MKIEKINLQSIAISSFTSVLREYEKMPSQLYVAGKLPEKRIPAVAIVGSRKPTPYGESITYELAFELAKQGVVIVSGLAFGIDAIAHKAALDAGGTTIAVLANGLPAIYPAHHKDLAERIVRSGGAVISEQGGSHEPRRYDFLARNRIISGLADAVLVTEATDRSGTFSTVSHAIEQNKEVFAVPGPITSLLSVGPNRLIQQGARVAITSQDILQIIAPQHAATQTRMPLPDTPLEARILELIQEGVVDIDMVVQESNASSSEVLQTITLMELKGTIRVTAGRLSILHF